VKRFLPYVAAIVLVLAFAAAWRTGLFSALSDHEALVAAMRASGLRGYLVCLAIQFAQVVIFAIPGEITQFAAGYVFGAWKGFLYSIIGIALGSAFDFGFARLVGRPFIERILGAKTMNRVDELLETPRGKSGLFLLFLIPGMPKDAMSYGAGLTRFGAMEFVVLSGLARTPALLFSTMIGSQVYAEDYRSAALIAVAGVIAAVGFYWYEKKRWQQ
jgi:uncharacterized membrane protein YdjX (TVP38/TMEM64 family)